VYGYGLVNAAAALGADWVKPSLESPKVISTSTTGAEIRVNVKNIIFNTNTKVELKVCKSSVSGPCQRSLVAISPKEVNRSGDIDFAISGLLGNTKYKFTAILKSNLNQTPAPTVDGNFKTQSAVEIKNPIVFDIKENRVRVKVNVSGVVPNTGAQLEMKICKSTDSVPCKESLVAIPLKKAVNGIVTFDVRGLSSDTSYNFTIVAKNVNQTPVPTVNGSFKTKSAVKIESHTVASTTANGATVRVKVSGVGPHSGAQLEMKVCRVTDPVPCQKSLVTIPLKKAVNGNIDFMVTGLSPKTRYRYTIVAKNVNQTPVPTVNGSFRTAQL